jgi:hypothetical protein
LAIGDFAVNGTTGGANEANEEKEREEERISRQSTDAVLARCLESDLARDDSGR